MNKSERTRDGNVGHGYAAVVALVLVGFFASAQAAAQTDPGDQVFNDVAVIGQTIGGDVVVEPDLADQLPGAYTTIVPPSPGNEFRDLEYFEGEIILLDGTTFRKV
ncbi:MAG: hypothetical protein P8Y02_01485 [Deinococcales bacterium]